uniref:Uncharacterized protein n=1 Tax=Helianthus annuus TaxID=4232 RepID=A0A251T0M4_HELAN
MRRGCSSRCSGEDEENKDGNVNQWVALAVVQTYNPNAKCLVAVSIFLNACRKLRFLMLKRINTEIRKVQSQIQEAARVLFSLWATIFI